MPPENPTRFDAGDGTPEAPSPRPGRRPPPRRGAGFALLLILLVAGLLAFRPAYRRLEHWRSASLVSQAEDLARQHSYQDAITRYQAALGLNPTQIDGLRGVANVYSLFEKPEALQAWQRLLTHPEHTEQDALKFIQFTLRVQRFDLAEAQLARLLAGTNISIPARIVAAEFYQRQGDIPRALDFAEAILRLNPTNSAHQFRVARTLLSLPDVERQREGIRRLAPIPSLTPQNRLALFQTLISAPALPLPETPAFLDSLPPLPTPSADDLLAQTEVRLRLAPDAPARDLLIQSAIQTLRNGSPDDQVMLGRWLNRIHQPNRLLEAYSLPDAIAMPPLLPAYLEALGKAQRWQDLQSATSQPLDVDPWLLESFRAAAATRLGQEALAREHWRRSFEKAQGDPVRAQVIGDVALHFGSLESAIEAFNVLANNELHRTSGYRRLAKVYGEMRDTDRLRLLMRQWSANAPEDPVPNDTYAYLSALLHRNLDDARARAIRLVERYPMRASYRSTLAFIELRRDEPRAALQLLQRARTDPGASAQSRLVHALVLKANGQTVRAREMVQEIRPESLFFPEEQELLRKLASP